MATDEELMLKSMPFFPHDALMIYDPKIQRLFHWGGHAAFGKYNMLCGYLCFVDNHIALFNNDVEKSITAGALLTSADDAEEFLAKCAELGLINPELWSMGKVCSDRMIRNAQYRAHKQSAGAKGGRPKKQAG